MKNSSPDQVKPDGTKSEQDQNETGDKHVDRHFLAAALTRFDRRDDRFLVSPIW